MKEKLLLHSCCAPCTSAVAEVLHKKFDITLFFYNPCITDADEYARRAEELKRFVDTCGMGLTLVFGDYDPDTFYDLAKGLEDELERGARCFKCYFQRLREACKYAKNNGFNVFSTTLSISPYKNPTMLNAIGNNIAGIYGIKYLDYNFSSLYPRSLELCDKYNLYQQEYCGCEYSKRYSSELPK
jgi:predicted adenine nucleotide alpha hydrolase (AANH) superfamily ATPase